MSCNGTRNYLKMNHSLLKNEVILIKILLRHANIRIGEVDFLELVFTYSFPGCLGRTEKVTCFGVCTLQVYDMLMSHGETSSFEIDV